MKYLYLLFLVNSLVVFVSKGSSFNQVEIIIKEKYAGQQKTTVGETAETPNNPTDFNKLKELFRPITTSYIIDSKLFEIWDSRIRQKVIPFDLDNRYLDGKHVERGGCHFNQVKYALCQLKMGDNIGLLAVELTIGIDRRHQDYILYIFNVEGKRVEKHMLAFSRIREGGLEEQQITLRFLDGQWIVEGNFRIENDEWQYSGDKESLYEKSQGEVTYTIHQDGSLETQQQIYFDVQPDPYSSKMEFKENKTFELLPISSSYFEEWKNEGGIENAIAWKDKNGYNAVFWVNKNRDDFPALRFSGKEAEGVLRAYHYTAEDANSQLLWEMKDYEDLCDFDLVTDFRYPSVELTDLDKDGFAEVTFMYTLGCVSDVSPLELKLMLYENGKKYALRGRTRMPERIVIGGEEFSKSNYKIDPAFEKAPQSFLEFAKKHWKMYDSHF